uniref:MaoC-like dehydratase n=1 Tax=Sphingomonas sp. JE1 TaxID=1628059 RepID=A0A0D5A040_9SPHN|nr:MULTISPECIES: MaoC/PaaZ C-terminal domain-containing protein [unclassified Sphingomonas]AJW29548.1 MaoC-like dehydratase [Sphingomonas sp. JE1]
MAIDLDSLLAAKTRRRLDWTEADAVIYAHGIGLATDPLDAVELAYVQDESPAIFPTFPVSLALTGGPLAGAGLDMRQVLHGAHMLTLHGPMPSTGSAEMRGAMIGVWDKGLEKGAVFVEEKRLTLDPGGTPLATIVTTVFGRAEGGCGAPRTGQPAPHPLPFRTPDAIVDMVTRADQALLYRLSGDRNPIHSDPVAAGRAGFPRPILHGLCSFAICARAVTDNFANRQAGRLRHIEARFSGPVYPGETIQMKLWQDDATISFEAGVRARNALVITAGKALIASETWL